LSRTPIGNAGSNERAHDTAGNSSFHGSVSGVKGKCTGRRLRRCRPLGGRRHRDAPGAQPAERRAKRDRNLGFAEVSLTASYDTIYPLWATNYHNSTIFNTQEQSRGAYELRLTSQGESRL
jgi:hypothetical protein